MPIHYIDRKTGEKKEEIVAGDKYLKWLYESSLGLNFFVPVLKRKLFSELYGRLQDTGFSRRKIGSFIDELQIEMREAKIEDPGSYRTFNDFFYQGIKARIKADQP